MIFSVTGKGHRMLKIAYFRGNFPPVETLCHAAGAPEGMLRRPESLVWRWLLRQLLAEVGYSVELSRLTVSPGGRPYLSGAPFDFSPTHTAGFVAVALTDAGRVGLDAETPKGRDASRLLRAADRWFTPGECARVRAVLDEDPAEGERAFLRVWTAKEALVKRIGTGLAGMHDADSDAPGDCVLRTTAIGETILTVAMPDGTEQPELRELFF